MEKDDELSNFRQRWKQELERKSRVESEGAVGYFGHCSKADGTDDEQRRGHAAESGRKPGGVEGSKRVQCKDQPQYVSIAEGLLDGRSSPLLARMEEERMRRKRRCERGDEEQQQLLSGANTQGTQQLPLIDQFIHDLVG